MFNKLIKTINSMRKKMTKERKKKSVSEPKVDSSNKYENNVVVLYHVTLPSLVAWPENTITLKVCHSAKEAEEYIENYPNIFLRYSMKIEPRAVKVQETD